MIAIVDYGMGNVASVKNALDRIGRVSVITADRKIIRTASGIIVPGVGSAGEGMRGLAGAGLDRFLKEEAVGRIPVLGICLGMQLFMTESEEGNVGCMDRVQGKVVRLQGAVKVPQVGWNSVQIRKENALFLGIPDKSYFYFVHSFVCRPQNETDIAATTVYGEQFCSAWKKDMVYGVQFHPEKSGKIGEMLLRNFCDLSYENNTGD